MAKKTAGKRGSKRVRGRVGKAGPRELPAWVREHPAYETHRRIIEGVNLEWPEEGDPSQERLRIFLDGMSAIGFRVPRKLQRRVEEMDRERFASALPFEVHQCYSATPFGDWSDVKVEVDRKSVCSGWYLDEQPLWVWEIGDQVLERGLKLSFVVKLDDLAQVVAVVCRNLRSDVLAWFDPGASRLIVATRDAEERFEKHDSRDTEVPLGKLCPECGSRNLLDRVRAKNNAA